MNLLSSRRVRSSIMQLSSNMKKVLIVLFTLLLISGCEDAGRQEANPDERYSYIIDMIKEHEVFSDTSNYFDITTDMAEIDNGYRFYITVDNPRIAMYDVELLAIEDGVDYMNTMAANVGIFETREYNLIPNQSNPSQNYMKGIVASAVTNKPETTLYIFVQFKNADYSNIHSEFFKFDVKYKG